MGRRSNTISLSDLNLCVNSLLRDEMSISELKVRLNYSLLHNEVLTFEIDDPPNLLTYHLISQGHS